MKSIYSTSFKTPIILIFLFFSLYISVNGQPKESINSPEIHADNSITFRFLAPDANKITMSGDFWKTEEDNKEMHKDDQGMWSLTVEPLTPDIYSYSFIVDGLRVLDQDNGWIKPGVRVTENMFLVPGEEADFLMEKEVPHGQVGIIHYQSSVINKTKRMHIYYPPGYDSSDDKYPVFYNFHAGGDHDDCWISVGQIHLIMDNLIAEGKVKPMVIVMPSVWAIDLPLPSDRRQDNSKLFAEMLATDIIPFIEQNYKVLTGSENSAIGGISYPNMLEDTFFEHMDKFDYVGFFSNKHSEERFAHYMEKYPGKIADPKNVNRIKVWAGEGKSAPAYEGAKYFTSTLNEMGYKTTFHEVEGIHGWPYFRRYFAEFVTQVFK